MTLNITINNELLLYMYLSLNWLKGHNLMYLYSRFSTKKTNGVTFGVVLWSNLALSSLNVV